LPKLELSEAVRDPNLAPRALPVRTAALLDRLRSRLWVIPGAFAVGSAAAAFLLVPLDHLVDRYVSGDLSGILFSGGPDSARLVLSTIAAAMMTFTGLVFSVTMLVLQLASSQLSPRVMRTFLRDRVNQAVLGLFVATFLYSLLVLREVRSPTSGPSFVPAISVSVAYGLLITSVGSFVFYIHHMAQAIRAATVIRSVADETRAAISRIYPAGIPAEPAAAPPALPDRSPDVVVTLERARGVVTSVDDAGLVTLARGAHAIVQLVPMVGDFVPAGAPLLHVWLRGAATDVDSLAAGLRDAVYVGPERTMTQDAAFGFRQLVDIAERALSPAVNDPTTAVQALDQLHDLLRSLAVRAIPSPARVDEGGSLLLVLPQPSWAEYVALALDEIRQYGSGSIQVARRLRYLLLDLQAVAPEFRREPVARQLRLLDAGLATDFALREDRRSASQPSPSGQGPAQQPTPSEPPDAAGPAHRGGR
jgi:uncharacterized membrane protein